MKWKSLFAAALTAAVALPAWAQDATGGGTLSLSFSFANGRVEDSSVERVPVISTGSNTSLGIHSVPVENWIDLDDEAVTTSRKNIEATDVVAIGDTHANFTLPAPVYVAYSAANGWSYAGANTRSFLRTYLDDGGTGASITVDNVPFTKYDVIVYLATDTSGVKFLPVTVNGTKYKGTTAGSEVANDGDTWGTSCQDVANLGNNALRVNGLETATLTIKGSSNSEGTGQRCGIAAFQIIQAKDGAIRELAYQPSISVNLKGNVDTIVGPSGTSGLLPVPNAYWNELPTSGTSESGVGFMDDSGLATSLAIDATYSGAKWSFSSAGRPTLGAMANGYREVTTLGLTDVPYSSYNLILYYASDLNTDSIKWAATKVTSATDDSVKYYTYPADYSGTGAAVEVEESAAVDWGATSANGNAGNAIAYGKAVMLIEGLTGDITLEMLKNDNNRDGLYGFQIVCTGDVIVPPPPSISVNVIGGNNPDSIWTALTSIKDTEGQSGLADYRVDNANWNELTQQNSGNTGGTPETLEAPVDNTGAPTFATVTARLGGWWHLTSDATVRTNAVGYMGVGFCDPSKVEGTNELTLANVPYTEYSLILYYGTNNTGNTWAAPKVTLADGTVKTYTYAADATGAATEGTDAWGSTSDTTSEQAGTLGKDVMLIKGLSGDISIDLGTQPNEDAATQAGSLCGFQIVCTGEVITVDPAKEGVISLNFNSGRNNSAIPATETTYGLVAVPGSKWQNLTGTSNADGVEITTASNTDLTVTPTVTFSSTGGYQYNADQATCPYLRAYLDDDGSTKVTGVDVDVANVPYRAYDVVVYFGMGDADNTFRPVAINGTYYRWDNTIGATVPTKASGAAFGTSAQPEAAYGVNAIRVKAQTGNLDLDAQPRNPSAHSERGGIAALQLVERKVIAVTGTNFDLAGALAAYDDDTPVLITFTDGATVTGNVTLPADAVVDLTAYTFGETAPFGGALTVNEGSEIRLPGGAASYTLASSINGTLGLVMQGDTYITITDASISGGTITCPVTYEWVGGTDGNNWSNRANWSSGVVPDENAAVTVTLAADDAKTITLDKAATVASLTITGPASGTATLAIAGDEPASLTIAGQMATSGNVIVTQSADITVNGAATKAEGNVPAGYYAKGSFDVNGATYTLSAGKLTVDNLESCAFLVGNGATFKVGGGEDDATLSFPRTGVLHPIPSVESRIIVAANGTLSSQSALDTPSDRYKWELAGGTLALATEAATRIRVFGGIEVSGDSTLSFAAQTANIIVMGENPSALTGEGNLALSGAGTFSFGTSSNAVSGAPLTGYTGELSVPSGLTLVLGEARPALTVAEGATVNITPTAEEQAAGRIAFGTSMKTLPSATFTVEGVDAVTPAVANGKLTLSWAASTATLSTTGNWSASAWKVGETTGLAAPESGVVVLDGTAADGITVTLDRAIPAAITTINVRGDVTLVAKEQQPTLPTCINVEDGATLGVGANFAKANGSTWPATWDIPANTTLRVTGDGFDFGGITVDHNQYIQVHADLEVTATGTEGTPAVIEPENNLWCRGKVKVSGSDVKLKKLYWLDDEVDGLTVTGDNVTIEGLHRVDGSDGLTLSGNNVTITGDVNGLVFAADATITSSGTGNVLDGLTDLPTKLHVTGGDLTIDSCATLGGALLTKGATLKLASDWASGQELKVSAGDNSATTLDLSAINPANRPTLNRYSDTYKTLPKTIIVAPSVEETEAGVIDITLLQDLVPAADTVVQVVAEPAWNPAWEVVTEGGKKLRITNVVLKPVLPEGSTLSEAATAALNTAAIEAGITGEYAVAITTGGETVTVTTAEAATQLQEVLECFTRLTLKASTEGGNTVTVVYDFGVVGIKRNTTGDGWVVTAKVQGENAVQAGFAAGNAYALTVKVPGETGSERNVNVQTVDETNITSGTVELTLTDTDLEGLTLDDGFTLGVSVSRNAPEL